MQQWKVPHGVVKWWGFYVKRNIQENELGWICVTYLLLSDGLSRFKIEISGGGLVTET